MVTATSQKHIIPTTSLSRYPNEHLIHLQIVPMKNQVIHLLFGLVIISLSACDILATEEDAIVPAPQANFTIAFEGNHIQADVTTVRFTNQSVGEIESFSWDFENGERTSNARNPTHRFEFEGQRAVILSVTGPGGTNSIRKTFQVFSQDINCNNVDFAGSISTNTINSLVENNAVRTGEINIDNNYNNNITILLYNGDKWLEGDYAVDLRYSDMPNGRHNLFLGGAPLRIKNTWGIQVVFNNGVKSCVRMVGSIARFSNGRFSIRASDIYEGS
jgi:hypothetical protein